MTTRHIPPRKSPMEGPITPGEQRVIDDLMLGHKNPEIAISLGLSIYTVKSHLGRVFAKYGVENREALILAEFERLEKQKCQASAQAPDRKSTPRSMSRQQWRRLEELRKMHRRPRRSRAAV